MKKTVFLVSMLLSCSAWAQQGDQQSQAASAMPEFEKRSATRHSVRIGDENIEYAAVAGTMHIPGNEGEDAASVFYIQYTRDGVDNLDERPVMFTFNGGPGSASVGPVGEGSVGPPRLKAARTAAPASMRPQPYHGLQPVLSQSPSTVLMRTAVSQISC